MFIQIIQGRCTRQDEMHALADEWRDQLASGADGWLGGTYGFTDDGMFLGIVRFESRERAEANSRRPEQGMWAERMAALFEGPVEFHDSDDVTMLFDGMAEGGFVQVIQGRVDDPARLRSLMTNDTTMLHEMRPDILGATLAIEDDGTFTETVAFTDEESARAGETSPPPPEIAAELDWAMQGASFHDLRNPWFESAR